jgi:hypothetical protein
MTPAGSRLRPSLVAGQHTLTRRAKSKLRPPLPIGEQAPTDIEATMTRLMRITVVGFPARAG